MIFNTKINSIFETIKVKFKSIFNRENSDNIKIKKQTSIGQLNVYQGLTASDAVSLINQIVDQKLIGFRSEAEVTFRQRSDEFKHSLIPQLAQLNAEELNKLKEPDAILTLKEASEISGRKTNPELRKLLANLVIGRIKNDKSGQEELKNLVYNEAVSTVAKLTPDQLKIITLCYLLKQTSNTGVNSIQTFNNYLNVYIKPFIDFKNTTSEFQHIEYAGCGSISPLLHNLPAIIRGNYASAFQKPIETEELNTLEIPPDLLSKITSAREGQLYFSGQHKENFEKILRQNSSDEELINSILNSYESHTLAEGEIQSLLISNTDMGKQLFDIWSASMLNRLSLTTVGIVIGATNFEQVTKSPINIDIWIN